MWVTFLNQMPIFGCYMAKFVVKNGNCKDMCHDEIGTCARYICVILGSKVSSQLRRPLKRKIIFTFTCFNFYISTPNLKLEMTKLNDLQLLIGGDGCRVRSNGHKCMWSWKCQQQGHIGAFNDFKSKTCFR